MESLTDEIFNRWNPSQIENQVLEQEQEQDKVKKLAGVGVG